ncbi:MAG: HEAT repeat domain-containing protein [Anaerolineae bacterium]|nr:HEAT repeat domain-containing protein [Anaerolineae bacterium]MCA9887311.1 HEAT repeat domain-containing protein [Anaerolineae bacterium]
MSTRQRIVEYHMNRLSDKSADIRLKTINELVLLEAIEALDALQDVFRNDPDAEVKRAAQHAGRKLYQIKLANENAQDSQA